MAKQDAKAEIAELMGMLGKMKESGSGDGGSDKDVPPEKAAEMMRDYNKYRKLAAEFGVGEKVILTVNGQTTKKYPVKGHYAVIVDIWDGYRTISSRRGEHLANGVIATVADYETVHIFPIDLSLLQKFKSDEDDKF